MENSQLHQYPWYYGKINRQEAEENLIDRGENEGCFLVRESGSRHGQWTLSVLDWIDGGCNVGHYLIQNNERGQYYFEGDIVFDSVPEMIQYYKAHQDNLKFFLGEPCPREIKAPDKDVNDYDLYEVAIELVDQEFIPEKLLYTGHFSLVWEGHLSSSEKLKVIAKVGKDDGDATHTLTHEANLLKFLKHENIVLLRGVISKPKFQAIFQHCGDTNLVGYLLNNNSKPSLMQQLDMITQILSALEYCGKMKCVHRNVKAKSVILSTKDLKCRLASFKNARTFDDHGYYHSVDEEDRHSAQSNSRIRWMSIEAARDGRFSTASDVWSFGILLTEIFTGGALPYAGYITCKVLEEVENGFRCPRPSSCPVELYHLLHRCWAEAESDRPSFYDLKKYVAKYIADNRETLSKFDPPKSPIDDRYAKWKQYGSIKQPRTSSVKQLTTQHRNPMSDLPLPPIPQ